MNQATIGKYRWTICGLVFFATTINYIDRNVISFLKSTFTEQLHWTDGDYANIEIIFKVFYAFGMFGAGRVIDKLGTKILDGAAWFHTTGITPALSDKAAAFALAALKAAKAKGITTSIDLNYRKKLWSVEKARKVMTELCQYVDVCIGNEEDADTTLGFKAAHTDVTKGELNLDGFKDVFKQMKEKFGFKFIASSLRESHSASDNGWSALVYDGTEFYHTKKYNVRIVDRVGSGDSFASGLIYGLVTGMPMADAAEFGVAASALKHTIPGDLNHATLSEVKELVKGDGSGRVQR